MSEVTEYECDCCGEIVGDVGSINFDVRHVRDTNIFEQWESRADVCDHCLEDHGLGGPLDVPRNATYVGVRGGTVEGIAFESTMEHGHSGYERRDSVVANTYEDFMQFVEENVLLI